MPLDGHTIETHPDILLVDKAADALRRHGWMQGDLGAPRWGFCLLGAARYAEYGDADRPGGILFTRHGKSRKRYCADAACAATVSPNITTSAA